ncbi:MAG: hypothetical protein LBU73_07390 [Helicobacteraceae bacterium]|jgi:hypothetical protein|nr:hypothetical protein [Helicobacteraceae bacterium]
MKTITNQLFYFYAKSLWRSGLVKGILFLLALSLAVAFFLSGADIGAQDKLFHDLILLFESFWLHALLLLWAYELCKEEELLFLARLPLSTPLTRAAYEGGRFGGLAAAFLPMTIFLLILNFAIAPILVVWQGFLFCLSALIVGFFVLLLSRFFSPISAVLYSAAILMIGNSLDDLYLFVTLRRDMGDFAKVMVELLYIFFPNFSVFDHQSEAVSQTIGQGAADFAPKSLAIVKDSVVLNAKAAFWFVPIAYAALVSIALYALSAWRFKHLAI